jgi:hypothetical protein
VPNDAIALEHQTANTPCLPEVHIRSEHQYESAFSKSRS